MIKRFNSFEDDNSMQESWNGKYVDYNDYNKLLERYKNLINMHIMHINYGALFKIEDEQSFVMELEND
jgi:SPX domain protein involved in polyphosphate accumulation